MTTVRIRLARDLETGTGRLAAGARMDFTPLRRRIEGDTVVVEQGFSVAVPIDADSFTVELGPTSPSWAWQVTERAGRGTTRYVQVPNSPAEVEYVDLVDVDPATLDPTAEPVAAWSASLSAEIAARTSADTALTAADTALGARIDNLAPVASAGTYTSLTGKPTLGTAAAHAVEDFATAAQGAKADTAVQSAELEADVAAKVGTGGALDDASSAFMADQLATSGTAVNSALSGLFVRFVDQNGEPLASGVVKIVVNTTTVPAQIDDIIYTPGV